MRSHLSLTLGLALLGVACSGSIPTTVPAAGSSNIPKQGGVLNLRVPNDFYDFDVTYTGKGTNERAQGLAYDSLIGFKSGPGVAYSEYILQPRLADKWQVSPDGTTFTFTMKPGLKFADVEPVKGRELTAADVKWTYEYGSRTGELAGKRLPQSQFDWMYEGLRDVQAPDARTVVIRFKEPFAPFLNYTTHVLNPILAREVYEQDGHYKDRMAGSGPFQLDVAASQKGARWVFKRNASYWDAPRPYLDEVRWFVMPDDSTAIAALKVGQVDIAGDFPHQQAQAIRQNDGTAQMFDLSGATPVHMYANTKFEPFKDVRVRRALTIGIDRDALTQVQTGGQGGWALAGTYPNMFTQAEIKAMIPYDPNLAKQLLADAGYPNGIDIPFEYPTDNGRSYITDFEILQASLKKAGIHLVAKPIQYAEYSATKKNHTHTMNTTSKDWQADIDGYLYGTFYSKSKNNYDEVNDPKLDAMLDAQRREADPTKRAELIKAAVKYINAEMYWGRALYGRTTYMFARPAVKHFAPNFQSHYELADVWVER